MEGKRFPVHRVQPGQGGRKAEIAASRASRIEQDTRHRPRAGPGAGAGLSFATAVFLWPRGPQPQHMAAQPRAPLAEAMGRLGPVVPEGCPALQGSFGPKNPQPAQTCGRPGLGASPAPLPKSFHLRAGQVPALPVPWSPRRVQRRGSEVLALKEKTSRSECKWG